MLSSMLQYLSPLAIDAVDSNKEQRQIGVAGCTRGKCTLLHQEQSDAKHPGENAQSLANGHEVQK